MNPQNLKLSQLRALIAIAETGNFSEAALNLNLSQSTVSHAIATLETELGVVLLKRGRYGAILTPLGERIVSQALQIQDLLEQIIQEANREKGLQGGNIRIVSFRSVSTHILPSVIAQFRNCFPDVTVSLKEFDDTPEMEQAVRTGQADIGFTYLPTSSEFEVWEILRDDYLAILPPQYKVNSSRLTWEQLASYPLILSSTSCCSSLILKYFKKTDLPLKIAYHVREDSTILGMVAQGLGVSIIPGLAAVPVPPHVQVCQLPDPLIRVIGVMVLKNALHSPAVYAFLEALRQVGRFSKKAV